MTLLSVLLRVGLPTYLNLTGTSDSKSFNTWLLEVMISSKNEFILIHDLSILTLQIIFDTWWATINPGSKHPIAWNDSRCVSSSQFYLHCGIEETGSPGIGCIICHQVPHLPSEYRTSSMGTHLLAKAHIAKLNLFTESEVSELTSSTVDDTALAIVKRQQSWGIIIVCLQRSFLFHIPFNPYWSKWQTKCFKLAAKDFETSEFQQDTWNRNLMLGYVSTHIPWNAIPNLVVRQSYKAFRRELVPLWAMTLSNICRRDYAPTVDVLKKQLPSWNKVTLALDGWTSSKELSIKLVAAYDIDRNWAFSELQLAINDVDRLFISHFER